MFALVGDNIDNFFSLDERTGIITTIAPLDYEQASEFTNLLLVIFDQGFLNNNASLRINVLDVNDNSPVFTPNTVDRSVSEAAAIGSEILIAVAMDSDATTNSQLLYSLSGSDDFVIDPTSGSVMVSEALDFEAQEIYILTVTATDAGVPSRNGTLIINVTIIDQNDNAPIITTPSPTYNLIENVPTGTLVGSVEAMDADSGVNAAIRYAITAGNIGDRFFIHPEMGLIFTNRTIDREVLATYSLTVEVRDYGY